MRSSLILQKRLVHRDPVPAPRESAQFFVDQRVSSLPRGGDAKRSVLIADDQGPFAASLGASFERAGFEVYFSTDFLEALTVASNVRPWLTIAEIKLRDRWIFDVRHSFQQIGSQVAVATSYPSVATAIRAVREGLVAYVAKPATAKLVLDALESDDGLEPTPPNPPDPAWPSLDRTIWEYINQVFVEAGSLSETARRLRLDRRSLRRMLAKHPPMR